MAVGGSLDTKRLKKLSATSALEPIQALSWPSKLKASIQDVLKERKAFQGLSQEAWIII